MIYSWKELISHQNGVYDLETSFKAFRLAVPVIWYFLCSFVRSFVTSRLGSFSFICNTLSCYALVMCTEKCGAAFQLHFRIFHSRTTASTCKFRCELKAMGNINYVSCFMLGAYTARVCVLWENKVCTKWNAWAKKSTAISFLPPVSNGSRLYLN